MKAQWLAVYFAMCPAVLLNIIREPNMTDDEEDSEAKPHSKRTL